MVPGRQPLFGGLRQSICPLYHGPERTQPHVRTHPLLPPPPLLLNRPCQVALRARVCEYRARSAKYADRSPHCPAAFDDKASRTTDRLKTKSDPMRGIDVPQKGARGNIVASRNRFGPFQHQRVSPDQPGTPAQRASRDNMTDLSWLWNRLGQARWKAWRELAATVRSRPSLGSIRPVGWLPALQEAQPRAGHLWPRPAVGPPAAARLRPKPGRRLHHPPTPGADWLSCSSSHRGQARSPSRPRATSWSIAGPPNPGADKNDLYAFIGLRHPPPRRERDHQPVSGEAQTVAQVEAEAIPYPIGRLPHLHPRLAPGQRLGARSRHVPNQCPRPRGLGPIPIETPCEHEKSAPPVEGTIEEQ